MGGVHKTHTERKTKRKSVLSNSSLRFYISLLQRETSKLQKEVEDILAPN